MSVIVSNLHKDKIDQLCKNLYLKTGFDYFVVYMVFNNGQRFVLSNMYALLDEYYQEGYYKEDYSYHPNVISRVDHYICSETPTISEKFQEFLEMKLNIHRAYYTVRSCPEVQFVFGAAKKNPIDDAYKIYKNTLNDFNEFCVGFIHGATDLIKKYFPVYKNALFMSDGVYLHKIIHGIQSKILNNKEKEVLYWTANGKSSEEIAVILGKAKTTIEEQKKIIRHKLDVSNMVQAVFEGIKLGYIGAFSQGWGMKHALVTHSLQPISDAAKNTTLSLINNLSFD